MHQMTEEERLEMVAEALTLPKHYEKQPELAREIALFCQISTWVDGSSWPAVHTRKPYQSPGVAFA